MEALEVNFVTAEFCNTVFVHCGNISLVSIRFPCLTIAWSFLSENIFRTLLFAL